MPFATSPASTASTSRASHHPAERPAASRGSLPPQAVEFNATFAIATASSRSSIRLTTASQPN